jgi:hypothetical protein
VSKMYLIFIDDCIGGTEYYWLRSKEEVLRFKREWAAECCPEITKEISELNNIEPGEFRDDHLEIVFEEARLNGTYFEVIPQGEFHYPE